MEKAHAIHISDPSKDKELVDILVGKGYEVVNLPDNDILLVPKDAQETVKNAAFEAQQGSYSAFQKAIGAKLDADILISKTQVKSSASSIDGAGKLK
jgi:hypothetical protein